MLKSIFSPSPLWFPQGLALIRIIVGALIFYHGLEIFQPSVMETYFTWEIFGSPAAKFWVYLGKTSEFLAGISLMLGLFTRLGAIAVIGVLSYVTFFVGQGRFWYEEQHSFLFVLFGILFLFTGPGTWALDSRLFKTKV
ncbi:MAG: DoxX family protein [Cyclobacteriaceae bacterium]